MFTPLVKQWGNSHLHTLRTEVQIVQSLMKGNLAMSIKITNALLQSNPIYVTDYVMWNSCYRYMYFGFFLIARGRELQVKVTICIQIIQFLISCLKRRNFLSNNSEKTIGYITREKHKAQNSV